MCSKIWSGGISKVKRRFAWNRRVFVLQAKTSWSDKLRWLTIGKTKFWARQGSFRISRLVSLHLIHPQIVVLILRCIDHELEVIHWSITYNHLINVFSEDEHLISSSQQHEKKSWVNSVQANLRVKNLSYTHHGQALTMPTIHLTSQSIISKSMLARQYAHVKLAWTSNALRSRHTKSPLRILLPSHCNKCCRERLAADQTVHQRHNPQANLQCSSS